VPGCLCGDISHVARIQFVGPDELFAAVRIGTVFASGGAAGGWARIRTWEFGEQLTPFEGSGRERAPMTLAWIRPTIHRITGAEIAITAVSDARRVVARYVDNNMAHAGRPPPTPHVEALRDIVSDLTDLPDVKACGRSPCSLGAEHATNLRVRAPAGLELIGTHLPDMIGDEDTLYSPLRDGRPLGPHTDPARHGAAVDAPPRAGVRGVGDAVEQARCRVLLIGPDGLVVCGVSSRSSAGFPPVTNGLAHLNRARNHVRKG
jgi:hypothetical protein